MDEPICIYCGASRSPSEPLCPRCGRRWIDAPRVPRAVTARSEPGLLEPDFSSITATGSAIPPIDPASEAWLTTQVELPPNRFRWLSLLVGFVALAAVLAAGYYVVTALLSSGDESAAATTTTTTPPAPTTTAAGQGGSSGATTTAPETATSTTIAAPTTTVEALVAPVGEPLALADIPLGAFAVGPIDFGTPADEALGRLATAFGQPDEIEVVTGEVGLCPDEQGRVARWGPFVAVIDRTNEFASYRLDRLEGGAAAHPSQSLQTLSGIRVGATLGELESVYSGFRIEYNTDTIPNTFALYRTSDGRLLLWGPITGPAQSDTVEGIYAPNSCSGGIG